MKTLFTRISLALLLVFALAGVNAQQNCNNAGNLVLFTNYDGGTLTINVDVNIPNLKIGVCSYEGTAIFLTGPFVANVTGVTYAGYNGSNNHCGQVINTSINGAPALTPTNINIMPTSPITNPNGYGTIICAYSCNNTTSQGGCNTVDQVEAYFLAHFSGSVLRSHKVQYGCWTGTQSVSVGGNCCPPIPVVPGNISSSQTICAGQTPSAFVSVSAATGGSGTITYTWQSSTTSGTSGFSNIASSNNTAYSPGSLSATTYYRRAASTATNNVAYSNVIAITVNPVPNLNVGGSGGVCPGGSGLLTAFGGATYTWMPGGSNANQISVSPAVSVVYTVYAMSAAGCSAVATKSVTVYAAPVISIAGNNTVCAGDPLILSASGGVSYAWSPAGTGAQVTVNPSSNTVYSVTGTDQFNCSASASHTVSVLPLPLISALSGSPYTCLNNTIMLTAVGAANYTWHPGNKTGNPIVETPQQTTTYTVTGEDANGCRNSAMLSVQVDPPLLISVSTITNTLCSGNPAIMNVSGAMNYSWEPGSLTGANVTVNPQATTIYTVSGDDGICTTQATIAINVLASPTLVITSSRASICPKESNTLTAAGADSYSWTLSTGAVFSHSVKVSPTSTTVYSVTGTNTNNCTHMATKTVSVSNCTGISDPGLLQSAISIYPNPSQGEFTIRGSEGGAFTLFSAEGKMLQEIRLDSSNGFSLKISGLAKGIYFLKDEGKPEATSRRIIIE